MSLKAPSEFTRLSIGVLAICFVVGVAGRMVPEHFPNLVTPLINEFDWTRGTVASIFSVGAITSGLMGPFAGYLFDKLGPAKLYALGFCFAGGGLILAGYANQLWQFYIGLGLFVGIAAACCGNVPNSAFTSRWFQAKLPIALAIIFSALGAGSFIGLTLSQILINRYGWRGVEISMGVAILCLLPILLILPWKKLSVGKPHAASSLTGEIKTTPPLDWTIRKAVKTPSFWGLFFVFFITANGMYSIVFQSVTYLIDNNMTPVEASFNIGLTGIFIPIGMISCGYFLTKYHTSYVALLTFAMTIIAVIFIWQYQSVGEYWAIIGFIIFFGLTMGTRAPIVGSLSAKVFRSRNFGLIYGCISSGGGIGMASGTFLSGWIYDITGSYDAVFTFSLTCLVLGATPFILIPNIREYGRQF
ncbi:MAG: MFS transporter [Sneathiella sp.]|nr:MFS transporter [Sneathiella sp.]